MYTYILYSKMFETYIQLIFRDHYQCITWKVQLRYLSWSAKTLLYIGYPSTIGLRVYWKFQINSVWWKKHSCPISCLQSNFSSINGGLYFNSMFFDWILFCLKNKNWKKSGERNLSLSLSYFMPAWWKKLGNRGVMVIHVFVI